MIRVVLAALFVDLYFSHAVGGWVGIVLLAIAAIFLLTSLVGSCPLYGICGIRTTRQKSPPIK